MFELRRLALGGMLLASWAMASASDSRSPANCVALPDLAAMHQVGNAVRAAYPYDLDPKSPEAVKAADRIMVVDRRNTERLRPWLQRCGWPDARKVGEATEGMVWSLVQHADQDRPFQQMASSLLKRQVLRGGAPAIHLAYLEDRIAIGTGQRQLYGTQLEMNGECSVELFPIDSPLKVDVRRKEVGMEPLRVYVAQVRATMLPEQCRTVARPAP
ncbi:DUF6624 domain-containing protein [Roseateles flavus]|uniref:DUF6624 domain-containing protein n=1 Tax=Roseateles flavus TaxID=3149041 RepID=A0ABV0GFB0_9BURK